jgi:hypothetical protein
MAVPENKNTNQRLGPAATDEDQPKDGPDTPAICPITAVIGHDLMAGRPFT